MIDNPDYLLKIVRYAQDLETYWVIDQSERHNGSVKVCSPIYMPGTKDFFIKRVYDYKDCYIRLKKHFEEKDND